MKPKIKVVYLIGQFGDWWADQFYTPQMQLLYDTGLIEAMDHIDIHVTGNSQHLPSIPDKTRMVFYHNEPMDAMNEAMRMLWDYCKKHPEYKILFFHSDGVTHHNRLESKDAKLSHLEFIHYSLIELWRENVGLLNYYDCTGVNYVHSACFDGNNNGMFAPHYRGMFYWVNGTYINTLNKHYLNQDVHYRRFISELWLGTNKPRAYSLWNTLSENTETLTSFYSEETKFDKERILNNCRKHLEDLNEIDFHQYRLLNNKYQSGIETEHSYNEFYRKWG